MPCCPNCESVEMVSLHARSDVRGKKGRDSDQSGARCCPSCGLSE